MKYWFDPKNVASVAEYAKGAIEVRLVGFLDLRKAVVVANRLGMHNGDQYAIDIKDKDDAKSSFSQIGGLVFDHENANVTANILDAKTIVIEISAEPKRQELIRGEIQ